MKKILSILFLNIILFGCGTTRLLDTELTDKGKGTYYKGKLFDGIGFDVYPNPFKNQLHFTNPRSECMFVNLINQNGQSVLSGVLNDLNERNAFQDLSEGLYILQYENETKLLIKE